MVFHHVFVSYQCNIKQREKKNLNFKQKTKQLSGYFQGVGVESWRDFWISSANFHL